MRRVSSRGVRMFGLVALALALGGCKTLSTADTTGSIGPASSAPRGEDEWRREAEALGEKFRANPKDPEIAIRYSRALRGERPAYAGGRGTRTDRDLQSRTTRRCSAPMAARSRMPATTIRRSTCSPARIRRTSRTGASSRCRAPCSTRWAATTRRSGTIRSALKIVPDEPSVLSNLGLSYALAKDLKRAEETLRRAADRNGTDRRVRQNLALVVGLQGRFQEAETIARADLPPEEAAANVTYLRQMLAEQKRQPRGKPPRKGMKPIGIDPIEDASGT